MTKELFNQIADDRVFDMKSRALQDPKLGKAFLDFMTPSNWGLVKAAHVRSLMIEQKKVEREFKRESEGFPGLFEAIEEANQ